MKGKHHSEATKQKMFKSRKGQIPWNKGKHGIYSDETLRKMSESHKGQFVSDATKKKIAKSMLGKNIWSKGKSLSEDHRRKIAKSLKGIKSPLYIDGRFQLNAAERNLAMSSVEYKLWREKVFQRDDYACQICKNRGGIELNADHILPWRDYPDLRYEVSNGRTLCVDCHRKTDTWGRPSINKRHMETKENRGYE